MKLLRWAMAGASVYVVYRYSMGRKAKGEDVFVSPEGEIAKLTQDGADEEKAKPAPPKPRKKASSTRKKPAKSPG